MPFLNVLHHQIEHQRANRHSIYSRAPSRPSDAKDSFRSIKIKEFSDDYVRMIASNNHNYLILNRANRAKMVKSGKTRRLGDDALPFKKI